jgi:hypothetical protein
MEGNRYFLITCYSNAGVADICLTAAITCDRFPFFQDIQRVFTEKWDSQNFVKSSGKWNIIFLKELTKDDYEQYEGIQ